MESIKKLFQKTSSPLERIEDEFLSSRGITLLIKREDLNDPELSGNKLHKLKYNLLEAKNKKHNTLLTFGGAYSNHIYAVAAAGKRFGFNTIGIIRGEEHLPLNPTLSFSKSCGMNLVYMDRESYRRKNTPEIIDQLKNQYGDFYLIPEGGTNILAVKGCKDIINSIHVDFDLVCSACGTGGTLAGIIAGLNNKKSALGFAVLRGASFLNNNVKKLLEDSENNYSGNWSINLNYHFGGYAKINSELIKFIQNFTEKTGIPVEPIYTGKMLYGIYDLISKRMIDEGITIVAIHTGGLQGLNGLKDKIKLMK